jgi:hypothetical protein
MEFFLKKLILGNPSVDESPAQPAIQKRIKNIKTIWNNEQHDDIGIEKILRLFLAISQFLFLGTYIKQIFYRKGIAYQDLSVDIFVLIKVIFPFIVIYNGWENNPIVFFFLMWFLIETLLYVPTLIFASDIFSKPRSYRRTMLLLFFNYMEVVLSFAIIYARGHHIEPKDSAWYDYIYFSFVTASTIGYGDYHPVTPVGKLLVCIQAIVFVIFMVLFFNFLSGKVEGAGYFGGKNKD